MKINKENIFNKFCILNTVEENDKEKLRLLIDIVIGDIKNYLQYKFYEELPIELENTILLILKEYIAENSELSGFESIKSITRGDTQISYNVSPKDSSKSILKRYSSSLNAFRRIKMV